MPAILTEIFDTMLSCLAREYRRVEERKEDGTPFRDIAFELLAIRTRHNVQLSCRAWYATQDLGLWDHAGDCPTPQTLLGVNPAVCDSATIADMALALQRNADTLHLLFQREIVQAQEHHEKLLHVESCTRRAMQAEVLEITRGISQDFLNRGEEKAAMGAMFVHECVKKLRTEAP